MNSLKDKAAVVVGGGQAAGATLGNGRAAAILFARAGARVLVVDVDGESARETCALIAAEGGAAEACEADVTRAGDCAAFAEAALRRFGRIDVLHNNAGTMSGDAAIDALEEAAFDRIQAVNVKGAFLSCRAVLPVMQRQKSGSIVNVSSTAALWSGDPFVAYNTSKAALNGLTRALVVDCARFGVRVNAVLPGLIRTPFGVDGNAGERGLDRERLIRDRDALVPLRGGMGEAWDVARAALFLASDDAKFITGALLPVDGGQLLVRPEPSRRPAVPHPEPARPKA